jgi:hypothetical protein
MWCFACVPCFGCTHADCYRCGWFVYVNSGVAGLVDEMLMFLFIHGVNSSFIPLNHLLFVLSILVVASEVTHRPNSRSPYPGSFHPLPIHSRISTPKTKTFVNRTGLCLPARFSSGLPVCRKLLPSIEIVGVDCIIALEIGLACDSLTHSSHSRTSVISFTTRYCCYRKCLVRDSEEIGSSKF